MFLSFIQRCIKYIFILGSCSVLFVSYLVYIVIYNLPNYKNLEYHQHNGITRIFDSSGTVIGEYAIEKRIFVKIDKIPKKVINAFISSEDKNFYEHQGVDFFSIARLPIINFVKFIKKERMQGASTITQQVVKNLLLSNEYSVMRKIKELALSIQISRELSKDQILELYLNHSYLGKGSYGVAAAAKIYFNKSLEDLSISECAFLAALPKAPSLLDKNYERAKHRRNYVINKMLENNFISASESVIAKSEEIIYQNSSNKDLHEAEYFSETVRKEAIKMFGEDIFYNKGLNIYTSINLKYQKYAKTHLTNAIEEFEQTIAKKNSNTKKTITKEISKNNKISTNNTNSNLNTDSEVEKKKENKLNGGLIVMDYKTGRVLALVGGRSYRESQFNRVTQAKRQIGSLVKAFIYLSALENNIEPNSIWQDGPFQMMVNNKLWAPKNYENNFLGNITMQHAFERSRNTVTVRLAQAIGINDVIEILKRFNIHDKPPRFFSIALGAVESTLLKTTTAFSIIANDCKLIKPSFIDLIKDSSGNIIYKRNRQTLNDKNNKNSNLEIINNQPDIYLSDPASRSQIKSLLRATVEKGNINFLNKELSPMVISGKTGTTNESRDVWFIGYSAYPNIIVGTYLGYDEPKELGKKVSGRSLASPIFNHFMKNIKEIYLANQTIELDFAKPFLDSNWKEYLIFNGKEYLKINKNRSNFYKDNYIKKDFFNEIDGGYDVFDNYLKEDTSENIMKNTTDNNTLNHNNENSYQLKEQDSSQQEMQKEFQEEFINTEEEFINIEEEFLDNESL